MLEEFPAVTIPLLGIAGIGFFWVRLGQLLEAQFMGAWACIRHAKTAPTSAARVLWLGLLIAALSFPCDAARPDRPIKIGVLVDMNGPLSSATGRGSVEAVRMAVEDFGGRIKGRRIEIVIGDHQNKPDIGAEIAREWLDNENVDVLVDVANSSVALGVAEIARARGKIFLTSAASSVLTGKACAPTTVQWTWNTYAAATGVVRATSGPHTGSWYFITSDFAFGHALEQAASRAVEKLGGKIVGHELAPFPTTDFGSFLIQAQQSKASVIALATAGADTVNLMKQAAEFGLIRPSGPRVIPLQLMIDEVKAIGLKSGQGIYALTGFYHGQSAAAMSWSRRFFATMHAMPTQIQAGDYSAVLHYLQAIQVTGTTDSSAVLAEMRRVPVNDMFAPGGFIREDGQMVHDMYLLQIKSPGESTGPWDLARIIETVRGRDAFLPLSESECPLVRK